MDNILLEVLMHENLSETFSSLEASTLDYVLTCWEKIRIDRFIEKDIERQQDQQNKTK